MSKSRSGGDAPKKKKNSDAEAESPQGSVVYKGDSPQDSVVYKGDSPQGSVVYKGDSPQGSVVYKGDSPQGSVVYKGDSPQGSVVYKGDSPQASNASENNAASPIEKQQAAAPRTEEKPRRERTNPQPDKLKRYQTSHFLFSESAHTATEKMSHTTHRAKSHKNQQEWFIKRYEQYLEAVAKREVLAQEILRLFDPNHPKTKLVRNELGEIFVASKAIDGAQSLQDIYQNDAMKRQILPNIKAGVYTGFGRVSVLAMFICESDFKVGNIYLDKANRFIKIDGDWCFAPMREKEMTPAGMPPKLPLQRFNITAENIERLPSSGTYGAGNWLDERVGLEMNAEDKIFLLDNDIPFDPRVREEINETLLKILLAPRELLSDMVALHFPLEDVAEQQKEFDAKELSMDDLFSQSPVDKLQAEIDGIIELLDNRLNQFRQAALNNPDFIAYLQTVQAEKICNDFIKQVHSFKPAGGQPLKADYDADMQELFSKLRHGNAKPVLKM